MHNELASTNWKDWQLDEIASGQVFQAKKGLTPKHFQSIVIVG